MHDGFIFCIYAFMVVAALVAIHMQGILSSIIALSIFSVLLTIAFAALMAPDVALSQAVINAGLITSLFLVTYSRTEKRVRNRPQTLPDDLPPHKEGASCDLEDPASQSQEAP